MQIGLKMEAENCPTLNMNAMENYLLSHSLNLPSGWNKLAQGLDLGGVEPETKGKDLMNNSKYSGSSLGVSVN